jgi:hypothetical protein
MLKGVGDGWLGLDWAQRRKPGVPGFAVHQPSSAEFLKGSPLTVLFAASRLHFRILKARSNHILRM